MGAFNLLLVILSLAIIAVTTPYVLDPSLFAVPIPSPTATPTPPGATPVLTVGLPEESVPAPAAAPTPTADPEDARLATLRDELVRTTIERRGLSDPKVLAAMRAVRRHRFMPADQRSYAYRDHPVPIGHGQTISQPYIVALMTEELGLEGTEKVLEIGTGSGYQAAVLAEIVPEVYSIEIIDALAERAAATLLAEGYDNVHVRNADGYDGWAEHAPYDAIIITCAVDHVPQPLVEQLAEGGRLILPLGDVRVYQSLTVVEKNEGRVTSRHVLDVRFVPMTGTALS